MRFVRGDLKIFELSLDEMTFEDYYFRVLFYVNSL